MKRERKEVVTRVVSNRCSNISIIYKRDIRLNCGRGRGKVLVNEIANITVLEVLDVHNNHLGGEIPSLFEQKLTFLDLSYNSLSSCMPQEFGHATSFTISLYLSSNEFTCENYYP
ncbi:leucine-rich receptor-like kinase family protein [Medicago truncatula]|uniref:Leucine-rich receptor-like kinase family protein n=1 Tax=Medicago truncatula TaxID=3880 RepID=G7K215_MEDTR|nr:leucine-rich receptor-like kinase family protein [Medicago truncatula]